MLVQVHYAPMNPSDLGTMVRGKEENTLALGIEGSGLVISSGGGMMANNLVGKKVSMVVVKGFGGPYQQYMVANAMECMTLPDNVSLEIGSMHFVNPVSAICLA